MTQRGYVKLKFWQVNRLQVLCFSGIIGTSLMGLDAQSMLPVTGLGSLIR
jgi:hypothetical protein